MPGSSLANTWSYIYEYPESGLTNMITNMLRIFLCGFRLSGSGLANMWVTPCGGLNLPGSGLTNRLEILWGFKLLGSPILPFCGDSVGISVVEKTKGPWQT